mmetsp:Transcript_21119/g.38360  ORF Transcript_21119/g.38360 Transcript_21119/m.38360 type:complete len:145 (-) Transcript_21119:3102-3536(-)
MSGITMDPAIRCIEEASVEVHPSIKRNDKGENTVGDPDVDDAYYPNNHVSDEIPTRGATTSEEHKDNAEYAIRSRLLRVAVPLMMTPFSVGGIFVSLFAFGPCSSSSMCDIQRSRAVIGSIMVVIPQALVQLIVLTTRKKQWGY